jgi:hypothetical protein
MFHFSEGRGNISLGTHKNINCTRFPLLAFTEVDLKDFPSSFTVTDCVWVFLLPVLCFLSVSTTILHVFLYPLLFLFSVKSIIL